MKIISHSEPRNSILPYRFQLGPTWALLVAFRLPIYLYRLNLGWMLGHRFLCLVHEGRKSGRPRETCLEVIPHNPTKKESVALSSRGESRLVSQHRGRSDAGGSDTGGERYVPKPGIVAPEEDHAATTEYARLHPMAFRFLVRAFGFGCTLDGTEQQQQWRRRFAGSLRLGAFRSGDNDE